MLRETVSVQEVCVFLNEFLKLDSDCLTNLVNTRHKCNEKIVEHESIQVSCNTDGNFYVGLLGVLNGMFGTNETRAASIVAQINDFNGQILCFRPNKTEVDIIKQKIL